MNWKLIFLLSLFGLVMAVATISLIPFKIEPIFWLIIFIICAYLIAKNCTKLYFWNGFFVSIFNCVWITAAHILFFNTYMMNHPYQMSISKNMPLSSHPRILMAITGPIIGVLSGLILGLFSFIASKIVKKG